jgi:hypothetical protein
MDHKEFSSKGGKSTSEAKRIAAQLNGKKGGRPRKAINTHTLKKLDEGV